MKRLKRAALCVVLTAILTFGSFTAYGEDGAGKAVAARDSVVRILVEGPGGESSGTGFGVGKNGEDAQIFVTNWHVVTPSRGTYKDCKVYILLDDETVFEYRWVRVREGEKIDEASGSYAQTDDGTWYKRCLDYSMGSAVECEVLYAEHQYPDVAVIRAKEPIRGVKPLPLKQVGQESIGKRVYTIGYPGSADSMTTQIENEGTINEVIYERVVGSVESVSMDGGDISRIIELEDADNTVGIVHHAHINHGNSGGPLVMEDGSVIGINTYGYGDMEYSVSIDIQYAIEVLKQLGIEYTAAGDKSGPGTITILILVIAAAGGLILMAAVRKKKPADDISPVGIPAVNVPDISAPPGNGGASIPNRSSDGGMPLACLRLQGIKGAFSGRRFALKEELLIGRDGGRCGLVYPAETKGISGIHCALRYEGGRLAVVDMGSTYGTRVNEQKLAPNIPCPVSVGDRIFLGSDNEVFQITRKGGEV